MDIFHLKRIRYLRGMQDIASFTLLLTIYFLGSLAIIQEYFPGKTFYFRRFSREIQKVPDSYLKVLFFCILIAGFTSSVSFYLFIYTA